MYPQKQVAEKILQAYLGYFFETFNVLINSTQSLT